MTAESSASSAHQHTTTSSSTISNRRSTAGGGTGLNDLFIVIFGMAFLLSVSLNVLHSTEQLPHDHNTVIEEAIQNFMEGKPLQHSNSNAKPQGPNNIVDGGNNENFEISLNIVKKNADADETEEEDPNFIPELHQGKISLETLDCSRFGGPSIQEAQELVYWQDIPSDANYVSPFHDDQQTKYLTFEPDGGGWNNIRMAMESVVALAVAMGRTLVMPPEKQMYLLRKGPKGHKKHFSFVDFFPLEDLAAEHVGVDIITMEEYLKREAMTGNMRNKFTGKVEFPPGNRTDWNGMDGKTYDVLREWLRNVTVTPIWNPGQCLPAFPSSGDHKDVLKLQKSVDDINQRNKGNNHAADKFNGNPTPVDGPVETRLEENLAGRKKLCIYDEELQAAKTLHFQCNHKLKVRMLVHFYAFIFMEDWKVDTWMKRFVRDHIRYDHKRKHLICNVWNSRDNWQHASYASLLLFFSFDDSYIDEIQCAAARIVAKVREHARKRDPVGNPDGIFDSFHIRRGK